MKLFDKKNKVNKSSKSNTVMNDSDIPEIQERPRICCIDIEKNTSDSLVSQGYNIYAGTLGSKIKVPNSKRNDNHLLLPNYDFPSNLHEYDIVILDLENSPTRDYKQEEHIREMQTGKSSISLLSSYPENLFDPRPLGSLILKSKLKQIDIRPHIIIVFTTENHDIEYETVKITEGNAERKGVEKHGIYAFMDYCPLSEAKIGKEISVCEIREDLKTLFESIKKDTFYNQTFYHPTKWENGKDTPKPNWTPLLKNSNGDIISISESTENSIVLYLPQIKQKDKFLSEFLSKIAPSILPEIFPYSTTFSWRENQEYWLPNHGKLLKERKAIELEYKNKLEQKDKEIAQNKERNSFLHNILTESGDRLVESLIDYLRWLGFKKVTNYDLSKTDSATVTNILEEDIQIELDDELLIIECKGIGGTSTDSDCSQISKIKHRRCKERNKFDVYALYIVNHQRYLPPLSRQNPPFTENQISDAFNDERGLLSTWQLFNLYYEIQNEILTKDEAQKEIIKFGLVNFRPNNLVFIDEPVEILKEGAVCIVNIENIELKIGDEILLEKNGQFTKCNIKGIHLDDKPVSTAKNGELGLLLDSKIKKKTKIWKKASS